MKALPENAYMHRAPHQEYAQCETVHSYPVDIVQLDISEAFHWDMRSVPSTQYRLLQIGLKCIEDSSTFLSLRPENLILSLSTPVPSPSPQSPPQCRPPSPSIYCLHCVEIMNFSKHWSNLRPFQALCEPCYVTSKTGIQQLIDILLHTKFGQMDIINSHWSAIKSKVNDSLWERKKHKNALLGLQKTQCECMC